MMPKKATKAAEILEMLNRGVSSATIAKRLKASPSYIWKLKKEMAHKVEEAKAEAKAKAEAAAEAEARAKEVDTVLDARADQYGSFMQSSDTAVKIKGAIHNALARNDTHMFPDQMIALDMIAVKISRIVCGNPANRDSWLDIAGYAKLVADRLQGKVR